MNRIEGLQRYVQNRVYREALGLPSEMIEQYEFLAQGEYNVNYTFIHPLTKQKLVLRVNMGSQMHLEHQIEYEFQALQVLQQSERTPQPIYVDGSKKYLAYGVLVMEYLQGHHLEYERELLQGAKVLAGIHSVNVSECDHQFIRFGNPLRSILEECEQMVQTYYDSPLAQEAQRNKIKQLMKLGWEKVNETNPETPYECCINTELNSTNFLVAGKEAYLVDWEKPLLGDPAQDLGHYLAPTTTFWKTDVILKQEQVEACLDAYISYVNGRFDTTGLRERVNAFIPITCLRGITWCAMAWVEYQAPERAIRNESTWKKLNEYLDMRFLEMIEAEYL
ncbi:MAG: aminoglycoside phosphotransferase family protein [Eubacteriales bacterium]